MNPKAIVFWAIMGCVGWLIGGTTGAVVAVLIALTLSFLL